MLKREHVLGIDLAGLAGGLRDVVGLVGSEPPGRVHEHQPEGSRHVGQAGEVRDQPRQPRGRIAAISGSRPTISVSVWWRAWLHRQVVGSRMIRKEASCYRPWSSQRVLNAVLCPVSCQRESDDEP
jgi:hypothetical protein